MADEIDDTTDTGTGEGEGSGGEENTGPKSITEEMERVQKTKSSDSTSEGDATDDGGDKAGDSAGRPKGAPEKYEAFDLADGFSMTDERAALFREAMKEGRMSQEQAQLVVNFAALHGKDVVTPELLKAQEDKYAEHRLAELESAKANPFLVGDSTDPDERERRWKQSLGQVRRIWAHIEKNIPEAKGLTEQMEAGGYLDKEASLVSTKAMGMVAMPDVLGETGDPGEGGGDTDWDNMTLAQKFGWNKRGLPDKPGSTVGL